MSPVVDLILVLVLMPAAGFALIVGWRGANWLAEKRCKPPAPEPIDRLTANLRRLRAELDDTETRDGLTAKHHRVRALRGAYIDPLTAASTRLDVPPPPGDRHQRQHKDQFDDRAHRYSVCWSASEGKFTSLSGT